MDRLAVCSEAAEPRADVVIVGGGPGGIAAALYLARFRRSVLLVDANQSRMATIPLTHNWPGFEDGVSGSVLLGAMKKQLQAYPVRWLQDTVVQAAREAHGFRLQCASGASVAGSLLLLATGVADIAPTAPHMREALRVGAVRYCPVCDAYEIRDRAVGVYANGPSGVEEAIYLRHYTGDLTLFLEGGSGLLDPGQRQRLQAAGIRLASEPVRAIRHWQGRVTVSHGAAESVCDTLYCALGLRIHADLAAQLGAACDESGYLRVDAHGASTVDGLYAVGDVTRGLNQIAVATGEAAIAASALHQRLRHEA